MLKEKKTTFVNLTPETIELVDRNGRLIARFPPSGRVAYPMVSHEEAVRLPINDSYVPVYRTQVHEIVGLPEPSEETVYIVGAKVKSYLTDRQDVLAVDTGRHSYRKEDGTVVARSFRFVYPTLSAS